MVINISALLFPGRQCLQGVTEATMGRGAVFGFGGGLGFRREKE